LSSNEHNWIDTVLMYRWFGDDLRAMASGDAAAGDTRLQIKYNDIRDKTFDGMEFNGTRKGAGKIGNETTGGFAMPIR
jgi:hypothetical protein